MKITLRNGAEVYTGLNVDPNFDPNLGMTYADAGLPLLDDKQIMEVLKDPNRVPSRKRFDPKFWIGRQINNGCNGWAWAKAMGTTRVRRGLAPVRLSGDFVYSQMNGRRDQGSLTKDGPATLEKYGACQNELVRIGTWDRQRIDQGAYVNAARFKLAPGEWKRATTRTELYSGLALGWEAVVAVHVDGDFSEVTRIGMVPPSNRGVGNHAVNADDIVNLNGRLVLDMPNTWGLSWGLEGRGYITWEDHLINTLPYHHFIMIRAASDDPQGSNPPPATT